MTEEQKEAIRASNIRPEVKLKKSLSLKKFYSDPKNREAQRIKGLASNSDPEVKKKISEKLKEYYSDPENREKHRNTLKNAYKDPEYRKKVSEALKLAWMNKTEEEREAIRQKRANANKRPEVRAKISASVKKRRIETLDEILSKNGSPKRRARENRVRMKKFYETRDVFYRMSHQINYDYINQYITDAEIFVKFFSAIN
jgi:hypothetical protein